MCARLLDFERFIITRDMISFLPPGNVEERTNMYEPLILEFPDGLSTSNIDYRYVAFGAQSSLMTRKAWPISNLKIQGKG